MKLRVGIIHSVDCTEICLLSFDLFFIDRKSTNLTKVHFTLNSNFPTSPTPQDGPRPIIP